MLVIAQHIINNPEKFWSSAKQIISVLPSHLKLHSVFPSKDMRTGTCVWEADSTANVQRFLDENLGDISKNNCYEVNEEAAVGLPESLHAQAHA